jgi:hypothetical protein
MSADVGPAVLVFDGYGQANKGDVIVTSDSALSDRIERSVGRTSHLQFDLEGAQESM